MDEQEGIGNGSESHGNEPADGGGLDELSEETLAVYQPLTLDDIRNVARHRRE